MVDKLCQHRTLRYRVEPVTVPENMSDFTDFPCLLLGHVYIEERHLQHVVVITDVIKVIVPSILVASEEKEYVFGAL